MDPRAVMRSLKAAANLPTPATNQQPGGYGTNSSALYAGQISPLVAQYQQWNLGRPYGTALPRDTGTFLAGAFGPLAPIQPVGIDDPDPDTGRPSPRRWQYPVGWNMPVGQPGTEGLKLASFTHLRTLADTYSVARACIQVRIQEILSLEWDIVPTGHAEKQMRADSAAHKDFQTRRATAMQFFRRPDSDYLSFSSWLAACLEEVLTIDALALYQWPTRKPGGGPFKSDLGELALVAGDTIRPLVDLHGGRPKPPNPAYQQYLWGVPRTDLMTLMTGDDVEELGEPARTYRSDQLLYAPYVRRSWTPYGFPPLERALIPVMAGLRKQQYQLDFFSEGCYDDETEILTRTGWKLFAKLSDADEVATRSPEGVFEWQVPSARQCYRVDGDLVEFKNKAVDLLVTPNHRMLARPIRTGGQRVRGGPFSIYPAQYFVDHPGAQYEMPVTSTWRGVAPREFVLPGRTSDRRHPAWERAASWLTGYLTADATPSAEVLAAAKMAGIGKNAVKKARELIGAPTWRDRERWYTGRPSKDAALPSGEYQPYPELRIPTETWCEFLGLFLAEGWVRKDRHEILIAQMPTSRHLSEIKRILNSTGLHWIYLHHKFSITHRGLAEWLRSHTGQYAYGKHVPQEVKKYAPQLLENLLYGMMLGDGHWGPQGQRYLTTTSRQLADDTQEIFQKTGVDAWIRPADPPEGSLGVRKLYVVRERMYATRGLPSPQLREYHGNVYCVTVPNGIVYVRRNNKFAWCGNSIPGLFVSPGDMAMTPNQIQQLQEQLNSLAGDPAWKHKIIVLPPGSKTMPQKPTELADQFDEIIMNQVCMAYDVMPMELGISPKVSTTQSPGAANQMAKASEQINQRKALRPMLLYLKSLFDYVIQDVWAQADMQWIWEGLEQGEDAASQTSILVEQVSHGLKSIDEARNELGEQPWGLPLTSDPVWATQSGIVPVGAIDPSTGRPAGDQPAMPTQAGTTQGAPVAAPSAAAGASTPASTPGHAGASAGQDAAQQQAGTSRTTTRANPPSGQAKPSGSGAAASPQPATTAASAKGALTELDLMRRRLRKGRDLTGWELRDLPQPVYTALLADLDAGVPTMEAIGKARDRIAAHDHLDQRETVVGPLADHYSGELMRQSERLKAGEISPAGWLDTATAGMHDTVQTALHAGARHALTDGRREKGVRPQLTKDEGDDAEEGDAGEPDTTGVLDSGSSYSRFLDGIATREADTQHGYLAGLLQDVLAATALEAFTSRFGLYGSAARSAYEEGYGLTLTASAPDDVVYEIVWHTTSSRPCPACNARNGQSYTTQSLPGWPGDGGFGPGALCYGGAFCRCFLEWRQQDSSWSAPINPLLGSGEQEQYDNQQAMQAQRLADVTAAREAFVDSLPEGPADRAATRDAARAQLASERGGWPSDVPASTVADVLEAHGIPTGRRPVP